MSCYAAVFSKASRSASGYRGATGRFGGTGGVGRMDLPAESSTSKAEDLTEEARVPRSMDGSGGFRQRCLRREFP